ncbi:MAG: flagellar export protein FliJ [Lachnospiraceae bacterium]|nr:flagellar export protein FliJ [Lachnospiraceae bacterium]
MARFRYRMQEILDIKLKMETQARQEFAQAKLILERELEQLERLKNRKLQYEEQAAELLKGKLDVLEILFNKDSIIHTEEAIAMQELEVKSARENLDEVREKLKNVMQERKVHETLKDKAFEEFLMEEKQQESKEIDELTSYIYGQKLLEAEEINAEDVGDGSQTRS